MIELYSPRPSSELSDKEHLDSFMAGKIRYVRKHCGPTYLAFQDETGWHLFDGDEDVTDKHPNHVTKLMCALMPLDTVLLGEMTVVRQGQHQYLDDELQTELLRAATSADAAELVKNGRVHEPVFFVRDILRLGGDDLSDRPYDERQAFLRDITLFGSDCIQLAEKGVGINPQNWRAVLEYHQWPAVFTYDATAPVSAPSHCFELSVTPTQLVSVVAAVKTKGSRSRELVIAQRSATDGSWFCRGRVPSTAISWKPVIRAMKKHNVPSLSDVDLAALDGLMRLGKGLVVELDGTSDDLVFKRLRNDKRPDECVAPR